MSLRPTSQGPSQKDKASETVQKPQAKKRELSPDDVLNLFKSNEFTQRFSPQ